MSIRSAIDGTEIPTPIPAGVKAMTRAQLIDMIDMMAEDWQKLNGIYNTRADEHGWCSDYEHRQNGYNTIFKVMKLRARATGLRVKYPPTERYGAGL